MRGRVRPVFRVCAWLLGPLALVASPFVFADGLQAARTSDWRTGVELIAVALGDLVISIMLLRVALTGRDPYVVREER